MNITKDQWVAILAFVSGMISLASATLPIPATYTPYLTFAAGVVSLALSVFFGVAKPIATALKAGSQSAKK